MFHQPDWQPLDSEEFRRIVSEFTVAERWVVDGGYSAVSDIVWSRADTVGDLGRSAAATERRLGVLGA